MREDTRAVRSHSWFLGVACVVALSVILAMSAITVLPDRTAAGDGLKIVKGKVYDNMFNFVAGADVTVVVKNATNPSNVLATLTDVTNETGWYSVTVDPWSPWFIGDIIEVTAEYETYQNSNSTTITSAQIYPIQYVNVTLEEFAIPEFGYGTVVVVAGTAGIMLAIASSSARRRR